MQRKTELQDEPCYSQERYSQRRFTSSDKLDKNIIVSNQFLLLMFLLLLMKTKGWLAKETETLYCQKVRFNQMAPI